MKQPMRAWRYPGIYGVRIGPLVLALKSSTRRAYFSERNRLGVRVLHLPGGWRIVARWEGKP